jgi:hypothetical protein
LRKKRALALNQAFYLGQHAKHHQQQKKKAQAKSVPLLTSAGPIKMHTPACSFSLALQGAY